MTIGLGMLVGGFLSSFICIAFFLEYCKNRSISKLKKKMYLEKRKCDVCSSVYFVSIFSEFWNCPLCASINRK